VYYIYLHVYGILRLRNKLKSRSVNNEFHDGITVRKSLEMVGRGILKIGGLAIKGACR